MVYTHVLNKGGKGYKARSTGCDGRAVQLAGWFAQRRKPSRGRTKLGKRNPLNCKSLRTSVSLSALVIVRLSAGFAAGWAQTNYKFGSRP
jgi:hypothetical protein